MKIWFSFWILFLGLIQIASAEDKPEPIRVLVVVGGHAYDEPEFEQLFKDNPDIRFVIHKHGPDASAYDREDLFRFDVGVLSENRDHPALLPSGTIP